MTTLRQMLTQKLLILDEVTEELWPDRDDGFSSLLYKGKEFAHFHHDNEIDLRLTKKVIAQELLQHPARSENHPNRSASSPWVEVGFYSKEDVDNVFRLAQLAIQQR